MGSTMTKSPTTKTKSLNNQDQRSFWTGFGVGVPKSRAAPSFLAASFGDLCLERVLGLPSAPHLNVYTNTLVPQAVLDQWTLLVPQVWNKVIFWEETLDSWKTKSSTVYDS